MAKLLFLCNDTSALHNCFTEDQISSYPVCSYSDISANPTLYKDTEFIFSTWGMPTLFEEEIKASFPKLSAVFYAAGTVQGFARPFLACGVKVFSAWAANAIPVAEFSVAQILLANKGFFQLDKRYRASDFHKTQKYANKFPGNFGVKVGLLGAGMIGRKTIELLAPYKLQLMVFDPYLPEESARALSVCKVDLHTIFTECQTISNHLANNPQTVGMLDYSCFSLMKNNATFINTGRNAQVVKEDLVRAMKEFPDRTALLDVTDPTEPLPPDDILRSCENILITPHRAGSVVDEIFRMGEFMFEEYNSFILGKPTRYMVTEQMLATMA